MRQRSGAYAAGYDGSGASFIAPRLFVVAALIAAIGSTAYGLWGGDRLGRSASGPLAAAAASPTGSADLTATDEAAPAAASSGSVNPAPADPAEPTPTPTPEPTPTPAVPLQRIAIVAGHWGNDSGAVCPDGLREVDINLDVAQRVCSQLESLGYETDLMEEFDPRLNGYFALALISIHADSCEPLPDADPPATGFKVASVSQAESFVPEAEAKLVDCLWQRYGARTGMYYHSTSVTPDMTQYHTFYEVDARTPAAIIETGFMYGDWHMLTQQPDLVAQGIVDGILCYLNEP